MKKFKYTVLDSKGEEKTGIMEVENRADVAASLQGKGYTILHIDEVGVGLDMKINIGGVPLKEKVIFMRQLATMLSSGLALTQSIEILAAQAKNEMFREMLLKVLKDVESGSALSEALAKQKGVFSDMQLSMIRAGEESGNMIEIITRLADDMEKQAAFKSKVRGAMIYPIIITVVIIVVLVLLMIFMIPAMTSLFEGFDAELPLLTRIVVGMSDFTRQFWWIILGVVIISLIGFRYYRASPSGREVTDGIILKMPVFGTFASKVQIALFARTMQMLLRSGIPILSALTIVEDALSNVHFKNGVKEARLAVEKGSSLAVPIAKNEVFPILLSRMIGVGEETGKLDEVLGKVADYYERDVDQMADNLTKMMEPIILVFMGGMIGFIAIAVYLPMFSLGDVIQ